MIIAAYIQESNVLGFRENDKKRLTHVNFAFALVKDGKGSVDHWENKEDVRKFIAKKEHLKVILSVGGWGAGGFSPAVATAKGRELLAQTLVDISNDYGFDGIDMDWEYPCDDLAEIEASPDDKVNYTLFMELLRQKLGKDKILSMAAGGMQRCVDNLELDKLMEVMDFINLMTYDMCPWDNVGYHTSLFSTDDCPNSGDAVVKMYESAGVSRSQLVLGAAFYARIYPNVDGLNSKVTSPPSFGEGGYTKLQILMDELGYNYDEKAEAPYIYDIKTREFITFDNPRSLTAKSNYVKNQGLGGIMYWEYSHDDKNSTLLQALSPDIKA